jgi:alkylation response protein AidB-like acyl-CoA dehydrogenase
VPCSSRGRQTIAQVIADRRDIDFVLYEQFSAADLTQYEKYAEFNKKTFDLIIKEARNLAVKEILATFAEGDREGVRLENGQMKVPACLHRAYKLFREGEWTAMVADPEFGGQGLPYCISQAVSVCNTPVRRLAGIFDRRLAVCVTAKIRFKMFN